MFDCLHQYMLKLKKVACVWTGVFFTFTFKVLSSQTLNKTTLAVPIWVRGQKNCILCYRKSFLDTWLWISSTQECNRGSPGDFSGEGGQSDGTTWLFQAALHQQVSPQTGRKISKQRKQQPGASRRAKAKRATLLRMIRKWFGQFMFERNTTSPQCLCATCIMFSFHPIILPLCDISTNTHTFGAPPPPLSD